MYINLRKEHARQYEEEWRRKPDAEVARRPDKQREKNVFSCWDFQNPKGGLFIDKTASFSGPDRTTTKPVKNNCFLFPIVLQNYHFHPKLLL